MKHPENFANEGYLQFTLREMQRFATSSKFWIIVAVTTIILGISGPFSTIKELAPVPRFAYWGGIVVFTFFANLLAVLPVIVWLRDSNLGQWSRYFIAGLAGSFPVTMIVWFINVYLAGISDPTLAELGGLWMSCAPITVAITISYSVFRSETAVSASQSKPNSEVPFFNRMPNNIGRDLISLQAQDHYVQVATARGKEMVLIRLEDAISELANTDGMRVHRSWWVAANAVERLEKSDGKLAIVLKNETVVPVSRTYAKEVRARFS